MRRPARPLHQPSLKLRLVMHRPSCPPDRTEPCGAGLTCASPYRGGISGSVLIAAVRRRDRRVGFAVDGFEPGHFGAPALAGGGAEEALLPVGPRAPIGGWTSSCSNGVRPVISSRPDQPWWLRSMWSR